MGDEPKISGILSRKKDGWFSRWVKATYLIKEGYLHEYKIGSNPITAAPLQIIDIEGCIIEEGAPITGNEASFLIHTQSGKSHQFLAPSVPEKKKWMESLKQEMTSRSGVSGSEQGGAVAKSGGSFDSHLTIDPSKLKEKIPLLNYLESFTEAVVVGHAHGKIIAVNSAAEKLFGRTKEEMHDSNLSQLMPEPYKSQHDGYLFRHEKFGQENLIGKTRNLKGERKNGEAFPIQISLGKLPIPGYYVATMRELDDEEETEGDDEEEEEEEKKPAKKKKSKK